MEQAALRRRVKELIIKVCDVKDVTPEQVDDEAILFGPTSQMDLTSLDAIEIAIGIEREFKVKMQNLSSARDYFKSVASLSDYIAQKADPAVLQNLDKQG
jgi:acyl carrier protein